MITPMLRVRPASFDDIPALEQMIERAVRELGGRDYSPAQIESALRHLFGVDQRLVFDGTYYVAEAGGALAGAGGWSRRRTLYGAHAGAAGPAGPDELLDPAVDAAKIRAFFVSPDWARRGVGRRLLNACEAAARRAGFRRLELMATRTGEPLYRACGFSVVRPASHMMPDGVGIDGFVMAKELSAPEAERWTA